MKFHFISSNTTEALKAKKKYINSYSQTKPELADIIIPIGGDGILHEIVQFHIHLNCFAHVVQLCVDVTRKYVNLLEFMQRCASLCI